MNGLASMIDVPTPGGKIQKRHLRFFFLLDCSGSMSGAKIDALNHAVREVVPLIRDAADHNPHIVVEIGVIRFSNHAEWHIGPEPVSIDQFSWRELSAQGLTATSGAIRLLAEQLTTEKMPKRGVPPVCILVSDGECSDPESAYDGAISDLLKLPWGVKAVRLAIGIKDGDCGYNRDELLKFVSHKEIGVFEADTPEKLIGFVRWASTQATKAASSGRSAAQANGVQVESVHIAPPSPDQCIYISTGSVAANEPF